MNTFISNRPIEGESFISVVEYTHVQETTCSGSEIGKESTLEEAKATCNQTNECTMIHDAGCNGIYWYLCDGQPISISSNTCSWIKGIFDIFT